MRPLARMLVPALGAPIGVALALTHCGSDAVGIDVCRKIEDARCEAAAACGYSSAEVDHCKQFYRDQCLHGIENSGYTPSAADGDGCVAAVQATQACAANHVAAMSMCPAAPVVPSAAGENPCDVILKTPENLNACAFVAAPVDAAAPDAPSDGDAASEGGEDADAATASDADAAD